MLELKVNLFFTGGRQYKITYTTADGTTRSVTTEKYKKGAYGSYDILEVAGLTDEDSRMKERSISFQQNDANGGARIYDMLLKVPVGSGEATGITAVVSSQAGKPLKVVRNGRLVILKNGISYNIQGQELK